MATYVRRTAAFYSGLFILFLLLSSIAYEPKGLWTYFTNWGLTLQYLALVSVLEDPERRRVLVDMGILVSWTVAAAYTVVVAISATTRKTLYKEYGEVTFWAANVLIHYLPPLLMVFCIRSAHKNYALRATSTGLIAVLIVLYTAAHDTKDIYFSDKIGRWDGAWLMIVAATLLNAIVFDYGNPYLTTLGWLFPPKDNPSRLPVKDDAQTRPEDHRRRARPR